MAKAPASNSPATIGNGNAQSSTAIAPTTDAERAFLSYQTDRDLFLQTSFAKNRALATSGAAFTITRIGERVGKPLEGSGRTEDVAQYVALVTLQDDYESADALGQKMLHAAGSQEAIALEKNPIRDADFAQLRTLLDDFGAVPNMALQEYPARKPGMSNSHGIVHRSTWLSVADEARRRGLIK